MPDPKPDNLEELEAAFASGDMNRIRSEMKKYERQLLEVGSRTSLRSCSTYDNHSYYRGECLFCGERQA